MQPTPEVPGSFAGREFDQEELDLLREVVETCAGLSRTELAKTVCELLGWRRAGVATPMTSSALCCLPQRK